MLAGLMAQHHGNRTPDMEWFDDLGYVLMMVKLPASFLSAAMLTMLVGCASPAIVPEALERQIDKTVAFSQVIQSPDSYRGKMVVWGGEVLKANALQGGTQLEVLQLPLTENQEPARDRMASQGRFIAWQQEFLDPATIAEGTRVTIVGELSGAVVGKMDEADYRYPVMETKYLHRWEARDVDEPRRYGPWWSVFGGVGFGGGGSRSGGGISIGF